MSEVVVTGAHIPRLDWTGPSPLTTIDAAEIRAQGATRVETSSTALRLTWEAPGGLSPSVAWRYVAAVRLDTTSSNPFLSQPSAPADASLGARGYIDLSLAWRVSRRLEPRGGVNNLFDADPPVVGLFSTGQFPIANGNTYPGLYDSLGRYLFVGLTAAL